MEVTKTHSPGLASPEKGSVCFVPPEVTIKQPIPAQPIPGVNLSVPSPTEATTPTATSSEGTPTVTPTDSSRDLQGLSVDQTPPPIEREEKHATCGMGPFAPEVLQKLHNPKVLLACLSLCSIVQGFVMSGVIPASISTLEKRFNLNSKHMGLFSAFYDIGSVLAVVPVSYFGNKGHKGNWTAYGMLLIGLGSFVCALPQFTTGPYQTQELMTDICDRTANSTTEAENCGADSGNKLQMYFWVLLAGQLLHGFGSSPLYTLGVTYLDENVKQKDSPVYLGIFFASACVGPALGYILTGSFLKIYGDIGKVDPSTLNLSGPEDPRWYGAWWIGFLMSGVGGVLASLPLFCFAKQLPHQEKHRAHDIDQSNKTELQILDGTEHKEELTEEMRHLHKHCVKLLRNPTYAFMIVRSVCEAFLLHGLITFLPKILENLFALSSSNASMITGGVTIPFMLFGVIMGGWIIRKYEMKVSKMLMFCITCTTMTLVFCFCFMIHCQEAPLAGANTRYFAKEGLEFDISVTAPCNEACGCTNFYNPVCDHGSGISFYSPCHAGCVEEKIGEKDDKKTMWMNCSCVDISAWPGFNGTIPTPAKNDSQLVEGLCPSDCSKLPMFIAMFSVLMVFQFLDFMPGQQTVLRSVKFSQRSLSLGLSSIIIRLLGSIPGPIFFGMAIDHSCILWKEHCGVQQTCLRYKAANMSTSVLGFCIGLKCASMIAMALAWRYYSPPTPTPTSSNRNTGSNELSKTATAIPANSATNDSMEQSKPVENTDTQNKL